jgi:hypothetical protein
MFNNLLSKLAVVATAVVGLEAVTAPAHAKTQAELNRERSAQICNNPPKSSPGQQTLVSKSTKVDGYTIRVELRSSNQSRVKWVRACVPKGTNLYLKDNSNKRYASYKTEVTGWSYADMLNSRTQYQACAEYPGVGEMCTGAS